jgi:site-specific recombinase XerC
MASFTVPYLVSRPGRLGRTRWYWVPSAALKRAGWPMQVLGTDQQAAIKAAQGINAQVEAWKAGGQAKLTEKAGKARLANHVARGTVGELIARYRRDRLPQLAENTQREYAHKLRIIEHWAADAPLAAITRQRVQKFKEGLAKPATKGEADRLHRAAGTMRVLRTLFKWAQDQDLMADNPAERAGITTPPPRHQVWSPAARDAVMAAARQPTSSGGQIFPPDEALAAAVLLGFSIGQREADLLKLLASQYVEIPRHKMLASDWEHLASLADDHRVMGIRLRQGKTARWIEVPVVGETRATIERSITAARKAGAATILIDDRTGRPWTDKAGQGRFQRRFLDAKQRAAEAAAKAGNADLAAELATLQFRDLRRTAVVFLGELNISDQGIAAITGHQLETVKKILETYMPRTTAMAATAISLSHARDARTSSKKDQANG